MSTTRETGTVIGNGLKTIFSRITTMQPSIDALNSVGISIKDMGGNVKPVSEILGNLASRWQSLSNEQRQNLGVTIAGRFQLTRFLALMNNWKLATDATTTSINSQGSSMKEQSKYSDSLQARINRLDTAWNKLTLSFGKAILTDSIIAGVEGLNDLATVSSKVVDVVGVLPGLFGIVGTAVLGLSAKFRAMTTAAIFGTGALSEQQLALTGLSSSMTRAEAATTGLTFSLRALGTAGIVGLVFTGIGIAVDKLVQSYSKAKQEQQDFEAAQQKSIDALTTNKEQTEKLITQYENLSKVRNKGDWSTTDEEKYVQISNQLGQIFPQLISNYDGAGNAHLKSTKLIEKETEATNKLIEAKKKETQANALDDFQKQLSEMDKISKQIDEAKKKFKSDDFNSLSNFFLPSLSNPFKKQEKNEYEIQSLQNKWSNASQQINASILKVADSYSKLKINPTISQSVNDFISSLDLHKLKDPDKLDRYSKQVAEITKNMQTALQSNDRTGFYKAQDDLEKLGKKMSSTKTLSSSMNISFDDMQKAIQDAANATFAGKDGLDGIDSSATDTTDAVNGLNGALSQNTQITLDNANAASILFGVSSDQVKQAEQAVSVIQMLSGVQNLSAEQQQLLAQATSVLTAMYPQYNGNIAENIGLISSQLGMMSSLTDVSGENAYAMINNQDEVTKKTIADINSRIAAYSKELDALQKLTAGIEASYEQDGMSTAKSQAYHQASQRIAELQSQIAGETSNKLNLIYDSAVKTGQISEKANSAMDKSTYVANQYKNSIDALDESLKKLQSETENYARGTQAYEDALQRQINLLKQKKDLTDAQAKSLQQQIASGNITQYGMITSSSSSGGSTSSNYASGGSTQAQIWNFLKGKGLSDSAIAGIMGNLQVESSFSTTALGPQTKYGRPEGLAQWLGSRLSNLKSQPNWTSLDTQLNFLWSEWSKMMPGNFNGLSASQAATTFESLFEKSGGSLNSKRISNANAILSQFAGSGGTYSGSSTSSGAIGKSAAETAQAIDQAKSDLLQLQDTSQGFADQMQALKLQIVQDREVMYDNMKKTYDAQLAEYDYLQNIQSKNSADWLHTQMNRESAITAEINIQKQSIDYLQQQIKYNNDLTDSQKQILSQDMLQRQQDLISIEQKLYDTRSQMANEIVDTYKQALTDMKDAATKSIDNMINEINKQADQADYKKKLADAQKSAQDIQNEINKLMLDDSTAAKKRIADLQKQLSDQNNSISQMITDNNKQQQIDNLNAQKDSISTYYDNMLNDEDKFAQMRSNILNINNQSIIDSLNSLSTQVKANVNVLGTSVVNTLIDAINRANGYMNLSTQNSSTIGHIASLSVGGITPSWSGSDGKLAVLHQDEMISNKVDTNNFLKSISLVKDMVTNIFKPSNLSGVLSPATTGGNTYQVFFQVDKMTGNQSDVNNFVTKFVNGIKAKGGVI